MIKERREKKGERQLQRLALKKQNVTKDREKVSAGEKQKASTNTAPARLARGCRTTRLPRRPALRHQRLSFSLNNSGPPSIASFPTGRWGR